MSFDIIVRPPDTTPRAPGIGPDELEAALLRFDGVEGGEGSYRIDEPSAGIWIEIDAGWADAEGDWVEAEKEKVNQVWVQIPASAFEASEQRALALVVGLAEALGWEAFEQQYGFQLGPETTRLEVSSPTPPGGGGPGSLLVLDRTALWVSGVLLALLMIVVWLW